MPYLYLVGAILAEVIATTALKASDGFTRHIWTAVTVAGYAVAFYLLALTLKTVPTGVAYAIWSGVGIVLIALFAWLFHGQRLDLPAVVGMALIIAGVVVMQVFSRASGH
jgi:small multidrug resistance pump